MKKVSHIIACILALSFHLHAYSLTIPRRGGWKTLKTRHFYIHYTRETAPQAEYLKENAEKIFYTLSDRFKWTPYLRIHVVLLNNLDLANGMATVFPRPYIYIVARPPFPDESIGYYKNWLKNVFTHELTHILTLDQARGIWRIPRYTLGRIFFPNSILPGILIEGVATYYESIIAESGRLYDPLTDAFTRTLADQKMKSGALSGWLSKWPGTLLPYLGGVKLFHLIDTSYQKNAPARFFIMNSKKFPFTENSTFRLLTGKDMDELWDELLFTSKLKSPPREFPYRKILTGSGFYKGKMLFVPSRNELYFYSRPGRTFPGIYALNLKTGYVNRVCDAVEVQSMSLSSDEHFVIFTAVEKVGTYNIKYDIYLLDLRSGKKKRLTRGDGWETAVFLKTGPRIIATRRISGGTKVAEFQLKGSIQLKHVKTFTVEGVYLTDPSPSPDSPEITYTCKIIGSDYDICTLDLSTEMLSFITRDSFINKFPQWRSDGIYFVSSKSGNYYLYRYSPLERRYELVSGDEYGIYDYFLAGEKLYYACYTPEGFEICERKIFPHGVTAGFTRESVVLPLKSAPSIKGTRYNPLRSLLPTFWWPWVSWSKSGGLFISANTFNWDALTYYTYFLGIGFQKSSDGFTFPFAGSLWINRFYPDIYLHFSHEPPERIDYAINGEPTRYWHTWLSAQGSISLPFRWFRNNLKTGLSGKYRKERGLSKILSSVKRKLSIPDWEASAGAFITWSSLQKYSLSLIPEDGVQLSLSANAHFRPQPFDAFQSVIARGKFVLPLPHNVSFSMCFHGAFAMGRGKETAIHGYEYYRGFPEAKDDSSPDENLFIRGFSYSQGITGSSAASVNADLVIPLWFPDRGFNGTVPVFLRAVYAGAFIDAGVSFEPHFRHVASAGGSINVDLYLIYNIPLRFSLEFSHQIIGGGGRRLSFFITPLFGTSPDKLHNEVLIQ